MPTFERFEVSVAIVMTPLSPPKSAGTGMIRQAFLAAHESRGPIVPLDLRTVLAHNQHVAGTLEILFFCRPNYSFFCPSLSARFPGMSGSVLYF